MQTLICELTWSHVKNDAGERLYPEAPDTPPGFKETRGTYKAVSLWASKLNDRANVIGKPWYVYAPEPVREEKNSEERQEQ